MLGPCARIVLLLADGEPVSLGAPARDPFYRQAVTGLLGPRAHPLRHPPPPPTPDHAPAVVDGSDRGAEAVETGILRGAAAAEPFAMPLPAEAAEARAASADACPLGVYAEDPADASIDIGVFPYHDIAPSCATRPAATV